MNSVRWRRMYLANTSNLIDSSKLIKNSCFSPLHTRTMTTSNVAFASVLLLLKSNLEWILWNTRNNEKIKNVSNFSATSASIKTHAHIRMSTKQIRMARRPFRSITQAINLCLTRAKSQTTSSNEDCLKCILSACESAIVFSAYTNTNKTLHI